MTNGKIPVGTATVLGMSGGAAAFVAAVVAFVAGDHSQQTLGVIAGGAVAAVLWLAAMIGRYSQAKALAKKPSAPVYTTGSGGGTTMTRNEFVERVAADPASRQGVKVAEDVPDAEEFSNVPRVESGITPQPPDGEQAGQDAVPPLEPGDYEEG